MSNSYLEFYFEVPLPSEEVGNEVEALLGAADYREDEACDVFSELAEYKELGFSWHFNGVRDARTLCIAGEESGNAEHAADLLKWLLPKLDIKKAGFTYCCYGDGEYTGGAVAVVMTDDGPSAEWFDCYSWLKEKLS